MEVEAKFGVPGEEILQRLLSVPALAGFMLGPVTRSVVQDRYLDTPEGALRASGFACRLRWEAGRLVATLKSLGEAHGSVHRRAEYEVELFEPAPPKAWPPGDARDLAMRLCGEHTLAVLLELDQTRYTRLVSDAERQVAEMNVAQVRSRSGQAEHEDWAGAELEVELLPSGTEQDLKQINNSLEREWGLQPERLSKFHRALQLAGDTLVSEREAKPRDHPHLTPEERALLRILAAERAVLSRRARLLLAWDDGLSTTGMLERSGLSRRRARYWRLAFRGRRLGIFPERALKTAQARSAGGPPRPEPAVGAPPQAAGTLPTSAIPQPIEAGITLPKRPGIEADDTMSEAGRKIIRFHLARMLSHERATRQGDDVEALHDMRVATRRLRAAFRVFGGHLDVSLTAPLVKGLRRTGQVLGAVRDLDVFREKVQAYVASLPDPEAAGLGGFLAELDARREAERQRLLAHLDSQRYKRFVDGTREFVERVAIAGEQAPRDGVPRPSLLRHVAPLALYERLATVRAYDPSVSSPDPPVTQLHALRIATKRLRYTLEFFVEVLGPEAKRLVRETVAVQDHLGLVQDGVVASGILRGFLVWGTWGPEVEGRRLRGDVVPVIAPGVAIYLAVRQQEIQQLVAGFPMVWRALMSAEFSRDLAAAVGVL